MKGFGGTVCDACEPSIASTEGYFLLGKVHVASLRLRWPQEEFYCCLQVREIYGWMENYLMTVTLDLRQHYYFFDSLKKLLKSFCVHLYTRKMIDHYSVFVLLLSLRINLFVDHLNKLVK